MEPVEAVEPVKKRKFSAIRQKLYPIRNQVLATLSANIGMCGYGLYVSWLSPTLILVYKVPENTTLESGSLSIEEESWIASVLSLGTVLGTLIFGSLANCIGTKLSLLLSSFLFMIGWLLVIVARYPWHLILSRLIGGTGGGCLFVNMSLFVAEISDDNVRGALGATILLFCELGVVLGYIIGTFVPLAYSPYIGLVFPVAFLASFAFFPSTPKYLLRMGRTEKALSSLKFYRNANGAGHKAEIDSEFAKLKDVIEANKKTSLAISDFTTPRVRKAFLVGITLMAVSELCGSFTIINYAGPMFDASGSTVDPNFSSFCLGGIQIIGTLATLCLIDKMGRKILLIVSTIGVALGTFIVGMYSFFYTEGYNVDAFNFTPVVSLSFTIFVACIGIIPIPYILAAELFPPKVCSYRACRFSNNHFSAFYLFPTVDITKPFSEIREIGATICNVAVGLSSFTMMKLYPIIQARFELYGAMVVFCFFAIFGAFFSFFVVEETKGMDLDAVEGADNSEVLIPSRRNESDPDSEQEKTVVA